MLIQFQRSFTWHVINYPEFMIKQEIQQTLSQELHQQQYQALLINSTFKHHQ